MTGFVYAIGNGRGHVKIGWANSVERRLAELNVACPEVLQILGYTPGTKVDERRAQTRLHASRIKGEWFHHDAAVQGFVDSLSIHPIPPEPVSSVSLEDAKTPAQLIDALGGVAIVALGIRVHYSAVAKMRARNSISSAHWYSILQFAPSLTAERLHAICMEHAA